MFGSHKRTLTTVFAVVTLLAMLAPAAFAAPEWTHGVSITAPTAKDWVAVNPDDPASSIKVEYTINVVGTQVDNIWVGVFLLQKYLPDPGNIMLSKTIPMLANTLHPGANDFTTNFAINDAAFGRELLDGWYDLRICTMDADPGRYLFCTPTEVSAVLVQDTYPVVDLEKPGVEPAVPGPDMFYWQHATVVTGQNYLMVGTAVDDWNNIVDVEFQYCDESNWPFCFWKESPSWITIASLNDPDPANYVWPVTRYGTTDQYQATWDSSKVPDDFGWIRMCVWNAVGNSNCATGPDPRDATRPDAHRVFVNNQSVIHLEPGWNLISTPIAPYAAKIEDVLSHLIVHKSVKDVWSYVWTGSKNEWQSWTAQYAGQPAVPNSLTTIEGGKGYWIFMNMEDDLTVTGTWKVVGNNAPPEYAVHAGANLIGYFHFGRPTVWPTKIRSDYLGPDVEPYTRVLYRWDAENETYQAVYGFMWMQQGSGYWLSTIQDGVIAP